MFPLYDPIWIFLISLAFLIYRIVWLSRNLSGIDSSYLVCLVLILLIPAYPRLSKFHQHVYLSFVYPAWHHSISFLSSYIYFYLYLSILSIQPFCLSLSLSCFCMCIHPLSIRLFFIYKFCFENRSIAILTKVIFRD